VINSSSLQQHIFSYIYLDSLTTYYVIELLGG
jgi:hypothetical protein